MIKIDQKKQAEAQKEDRSCDHCSNVARQELNTSSYCVTVLLGAVQHISLAFNLVFMFHEQLWKEKKGKMLLFVCTESVAGNVEHV